MESTCSSLDHHGYHQISFPSSMQASNGNGFKIVQNIFIQSSSNLQEANQLGFLCQQLIDCLSKKLDKLIEFGGFRVSHRCNEILVYLEIDVPPNGTCNRRWRMSNNLLGSCVLAASWDPIGLQSESGKQYNAKMCRIILWRV